MTLSTSDVGINPFTIKVAQADIDDLRRRLAATRWPEAETVADRSQGAPLGELRGLVDYWATDYDWHRLEDRLNALPHFTTEIDGVIIHFIHVRSPHQNALPLLITHGWPGSILEFLDTIGPLTDPAAHGASIEDAFDVVIPSITGYGFSGRPKSTGWDPDHVARAWAELMGRLGYGRYVAQGGDWGSVITEALGRQAPQGLLGIHSNLPAALPGDVAAALGSGKPPDESSDEERATFAALVEYRMSGSSAYFDMLTARPQAMGYGMTDSPVGLAAWLLVHPGFAKWSFGEDPAQSPTKDQVLDDFSLYWLTNTAASSARLYWENRGKPVIVSPAQKTTEITVPVGITVFPDDVYRPPESWARRSFPTLAYYHAVDRGGHFAAWEYPDLFSSELRASFRPLRSRS
jgi:pimeloyl-ACP methyl ester carboxylesterase